MWEREFGREFVGEREWWERECVWEIERVCGRERMVGERVCGRESVWERECGRERKVRGRECGRECGRKRESVGERESECGREIE